MTAPAHNLPISPTDLRHAVFVREFLQDFNSTQAAIRAGYSPKSAATTGYNLLQHPGVQAEIKRKFDEITNGLEISARRVMEELGRIAFSRPAAYFQDGVPVDPSKLDERAASALAGFETTLDMNGNLSYKHKLWDKTKALNLLARHFKLITDGPQVAVFNSATDGVHIDARTKLPLEKLSLETRRKVLLELEREEDEQHTIDVESEVIDTEASSLPMFASPPIPD